MTSLADNPDLQSAQNMLNSLRTIALATGSDTMWRQYKPRIVRLVARVCENKPDWAEQAVCKAYDEQLSLTHVVAQLRSH